MEESKSHSIGGLLLWSCCKVFKALEADPEVGIRYDTERAAEKHSKELEGLVGAAAGALTSAMSKVTAVRWSFN